MRKTIALLSILLMFSFVPQADAMILFGKLTGGTAYDEDKGGFRNITGLTDFSVGNNDFDKNRKLFGFDEQQDVPVMEELLSNTWTRLPLASISAGVVLDSHYIFFDPKGSRTVEGFVRFDNPIYAVMTSSKNLENSDSLFKRDDVTYKTPSLRGLESNDWVKVAKNNPNKLKLSWRASSPGDYIRV